MTTRQVLSAVLATAIATAALAVPAFGVPRLFELDLRCLFVVALSSVLAFTIGTVWTMVIAAWRDVKS